MKRDFIVRGLAKGARLDGRGLLEFRPVEVDYSFTKSAEGSARIKLGETEVMVGVKMAVESPYPDTPDHGNLAVNAELLPLSNPAFEGGPPGNQAIELARVVDRGIREAHALDVHKLCIKPGEKVWSVIIDVCTINDAGNLMDASALGALAALRDSRFPKYENGVVDYLVKTDVSLPLLREPIAVTVCKIDSFLFVDPLPEEEDVIDAKLVVTVTKEGTICALQKGGAQPLELEDVMKMVDIALEIAPKLRKHL